MKQCLCLVILYLISLLTICNSISGVGGWGWFRPSTANDNSATETKRNAKNKNNQVDFIAREKETTKLDHSKPLRRRLIPQLPPHEDTRYILELVGNDPHSTKFMQPIVERLEEDINTKVRKINIQQRPDFMILFEAIGGNEGEQLPFFYNRRTRKAISGPTYYQNLLNLACGLPSLDFVGSFAESNQMREMRSTGLPDTIKEFMYRQSKQSNREVESEEDE